MKAKLASFAAGVLFAVGLAISGMTKPSKVVGFLDVFGNWDASLAFVMIGAIGVHLLATRFITRRSSPLFDVQFHLPTRKDIDIRLVLGAALFGIGWGLAGFCPGPGIVTAASGATAALVFLGGMTLGMKLEHAASRVVSPGATPVSAATGASVEADPAD